MKKKGPSLEFPGYLDTANAQVGNIIEDGGGYVDGATSTARALVHHLSRSCAAVCTDGDPSTALRRVVGVRVIPVLGRSQSNHRIIVVVPPAASTKPLYRKSA